MQQQRPLQLTLSVPVTLRDRPSSDGEQVAQLPAGSRVSIAGWENGWIRASADKGEGWFALREEPELLRIVKRASREDELHLFPSQALQFLREAVGFAWSDSDAQRDAFECLDSLLAPVQILQDFARDAHGYLNGDPNAESRFLSLLHSLGGVAADGQPGECAAIQTTSLPFSSLPTPSFPRRPGFPCFFDSFAFGRAFAGIRRLAEVLGQSRNESSEKFYDSLSTRLQSLLVAADRIEGLFGAARAVDPLDAGSFDRFRRTFAFLTAQPASGSAFPPPGEPTPPIPFPGGRDFFPIDPCALERWAGTERVSRCFCRESYQITRIVNLDHDRSDGEELIGEGCIGNLIRIEGSGFGESRDWGFAGEMSEVIFTGTARMGAAVADADYVSWSDTSVEVRVPAAARSGPVSMRILCRGVDVSECGVQLRNPRGDLTDRTFTLPEAPTIDHFASPAPQPWCSDVSLLVRVQNAEVVEIRNDRGDVVPFPEGAAGARRDIDARVLVSEVEDVTYTLTARNVCAEASASITVERNRQFLIYPSGNVHSGDSATVNLQHYCTPERLGWEDARFTLTWDDPDGALVDPPGSVVVPRDASLVSFTVDTTTCGRIRVTATAEDPSRYDHPTSDSGFFVYGTPHIDEVEPRGANACDAFRFDVTGECLIPQERHLQVHLTRTSDGRRERARIMEVISGPGGSVNGVTIVCETPPRLREHQYDVTVEQFGLTSNPLALTRSPLRIPGPRIESFTSSSSTVERRIREDLDLRWDVRHASRVELWVSGGRLGRGPEVIHREDGPPDICGAWSGRVADWIVLPVTYRLTAYAHGSSRSVEATLEITDRSEPPPTPMPVGARELRIRNCAPDHHTLHVWLRTLVPAGSWGERGTVSAGYDRWGTCPSTTADDLVITLDDGVVYEMQLVDPAQATCDGRNDPTLSNCWRLNPPAQFLGDSDGVGVDYVFGIGIVALY